MSELQPVQPPEGLAWCLHEIQRGPWAFIQLRGERDWTHYLSADDDIDLLGSRDAVDALLEHVYGWVQSRRCHAYVVSRQPAKVQLTLFSIDGTSQVVLDLWVRLWQFDHKRSYLAYKDASLAPGQDGGIHRLAVECEACIYLQHLICKKKDLQKPAALARLAHYQAACPDGSRAQALVTQTLETGVIDQGTDHASLQLLKDHLDIRTPSRVGRCAQRLLHKLREAWLAAPRKRVLVSIMGSDGAGKTTIAQRLVEDLPALSRVITGKHLYRKSYLYKLLVIFIRPLLFQSRELFDERLAPLVYLRACLGLQIKLWRHRRTGLALMDRSLADFLYRNRKTDRPRFSRFKFLSFVAGRRIPVIHCIVSPRLVQGRKDEMTPAGIAVYNQDMYALGTGRTPTNYLAFNNDGSLEQAVQALKRMLPHIG